MGRSLWSDIEGTRGRVLYWSNVVLWKEMLWEARSTLLRVGSCLHEEEAALAGSWGCVVYKQWLNRSIEQSCSVLAKAHC